MVNRTTINYEKLLEKIVEKVSEERYLSEEALSAWLKQANEYLEHAGELSLEELEDLNSYLRRDLHAFAERMEPTGESEESSLWLASIADSVWHSLAEVTDKTQVEWRELKEDLAHDGIYRAKEQVGLGVICCTQCGHQQEVYHAIQLKPCIECEGTEFYRKPFRP